MASIRRVGPGVYPDIAGRIEVIRAGGFVALSGGERQVEGEAGSAVEAWRDAPCV